MNEMGKVQVYTGDGKGKTTAALGLAMRAVGKGYKVYMIQFMKGDINYGELATAEKLEGFTIKQMGRPSFVDRKDPDPVDIQMALEALEHGREIMQKGEHDILILDEVNCAVDWGLIEVDKVVEFIKAKPENLELVLTGRYAPKELIDLADLVTDMKEVKHPFQEGGKARDGIEL
jgi:cob(I)alamin adenosyltransferase